MDRAIAMLKQLRELEKRPEGTPDDWTEPLRERVAILREIRDRNAHFIASMKTTSKISPRSQSSNLISGPARIFRLPISDDQRSLDECEIQNYGLRGRLAELAVMGRISKEEYDELAARLTEIGYSEWSR
jgi:hypothetical protein